MAAARAGTRLKINTNFALNAREECQTNRRDTEKLDNIMVKNEC